MKKNKKTDLMTIGAVAKKLGIHEQTIRTYEKEGLFKPFKSEKKTRFFSDKDVTKLVIIIMLTQELGLNRKGVSFFLSITKKYKIKDEELLDMIEDYKSSPTSNLDGS